MDFRSAALEGESTASRGQATLRRLLRENNVSDRMLTPATDGKIDSRSGSVFAPVSPVRNIRFSELTAAETSSLPLHFSDNDEGRRTPDDWGRRETVRRNDGVEYPIVREDLGTRSPEQYVGYEDSKEDQQREWLEPNYPPGIFRYVLSDRCEDCTRGEIGISRGTECN
jgi:hypothetical protein